MYISNLIKDGVLIVKACLSNLLAIFAPKLYINLTHQTGRGSEETDALQVANYFMSCFDDYQDQLELDKDSFRKYLNGKTILEYGPGDILGVAFLLYANGAESVTCIDRFPLSKMTDINIKIYKHLLNSLNNGELKRAENAFKKKGDPRSGFNEKVINYKITRNGLSDGAEKYDLVVSRAVLEHVNNLEETMKDIKCSMKEGGISVHQVDLKSHGLDRYEDFDFLTWSSVLYQLMYSHKGFPNRWRVDKYKEISKNINLDITSLTATSKLNQEKLKIIYPMLAKEFRRTSLEELSWKGFWIHFKASPLTNTSVPF